MIALLDLLMKSRVAVFVLAAVIVLGGLFTWHKADKIQAVRQAREGYVTRAELASTRAELEELRRRKFVADRARRHLNLEIAKARVQSEAAEQELEHYVSTIEDSCVVQPDILDRLRNR